MVTMEPTLTYISVFLAGLAAGYGACVLLESRWRFNKTGRRLGIALLIVSVGAAAVQAARLWKMEHPARMAAKTKETVAALPWNRLTVNDATVATVAPFTVSRSDDLTIRTLELTGEPEYVCSRGKDIYHRVGCSRIGLMKAENLQAYKTLADVPPDKKPCQTCCGKEVAGK
jgi:hypothetical protein